MKIQEKLLLKPKDFNKGSKGKKIDGVFNPAAVRMKDGRIFLFVRVAEELNKIPKKEIEKQNGNVILLRSGVYILSNISHFRRVYLDETGFNVKYISEKPDFTGGGCEAELGVEDPRIVRIGGSYIMTYVSVDLRDWVSTSIALSKDLKNWKRKGIIFRNKNKDVVIFPEKINGRYVSLNRPEGSLKFSGPSISISYSKNLVKWNNKKSIIKTRKNSWDSERIGAGTPPIKTKKGWLFFYHGVSLNKNKKQIYSAGSVLLNLKNPEKVIARTPTRKPLFKPDKSYEKSGFVNNVVFPTGIILDKNKKDILIYSGAGDKYVTVRKIPIKDILASMEYY